MTAFTYRLLNVSIHDKHESPGKRRRGGNVDRMGVIFDSAREAPVLFPDQDGEDLGAFAMRFELGFANYLNALGNDGWEMKSFAPWQVNSFRFYQEGFSHLRDVSYAGIYVLIKATHIH